MHSSLTVFHRSALGKKPHKDFEKGDAYVLGLNRREIVAGQKTQDWDDGRRVHFFFFFNLSKYSVAVELQRGFSFLFFSVLLFSAKI